MQKRCPFSCRNVKTYNLQKVMVSLLLCIAPFVLTLHYFSTNSMSVSPTKTASSTSPISPVAISVPPPPSQIYLRHDQTSELIPSATRDNITIFAYAWVIQALDKLTQELDGVEFEVREKVKSSPNPQWKVIERFTISVGTAPLTLRRLQQIARNEEVNVSGRLRMNYYRPGVSKEGTVYSIKDLVRQTIIVGRDKTTHYGGYPSGTVARRAQSDPVYICDLTGLQFQQRYNSGRLVLIEGNSTHEGTLDKLIFEKVVGEPKKSLPEVLNEVKLTSGRYIPIRDNVYFDSVAYRKFVAGDVFLCGMALAGLARTYGDKINFKFLKYGAGFFAGGLSPVIDKHILHGVIDGLETLFGTSSYNNEDFNAAETIKYLEFPFYSSTDAGAVKRLQDLGREYKVEWGFSSDDALKSTRKSQGLLTATTNCGDPHAAFGNEMGYSSVDASIAENLKSKGNIFCPNLNKKITEAFI